MQARPVLLIAAAIVALTLVIAGCGSGDGASGSDPAALAPPRSPLFVEAVVRPEGELRSNIETQFERISGIDTDLGELIVSELESSAGSAGEELDFDKEIKPWLGERAGLFFQEYDGEDFTGYGVAVQTTDADASRDFVDEQSESSDDPMEDGSYDGVDFKVDGDDGTAVGVIGDFLAIAEDERTFELMVDASSGESLADEDLYSETVAAAPEDSFADVFVDIGGLIEQSGGTIDPEARQFLDSAGIEAKEATAVASLTPGSEQIEIDLSSDLGVQSAPSEDASSLLGSLPASSVAAFALADFGGRFGEALDQIDANGIPGEIPPNKFKSTLKEAGIDVEKIAASIGDLGVFAEGSSESSLAGAAVLTTKGAQEARNTVANVGLLLRASGTPGVTRISGGLSGFSVRGADLGPKPLVVAAQGERIAIGYGLPAATRALAPGSGQGLAGTPGYKRAASALGDIPITGFVDGAAARQLVTSIVAGTEDEEEVEEVLAYLRNVDFLAIGAGAADDLTTAKLIVGTAER